jgi:hypothetical protein
MDIQIEGEEAGNTAMHPPETGTETGAELSLEEAERISGLEMPLPELEGATVGQCSAREGRIELFYFNQEGEEVFRIIKEALDERREELPLESEDGSSAVWTDGRYRWMILSEKEELSPERIREMREKLSSGK